LAVLEDFIEAGNVDVGELLLLVVRAGLVHRVLDDVVHRALRHVDSEQIAAKFLDAAVGTVAEQEQAEGDLPQPRLGHRQGEEHVIIRHLGSEGFLQGGVGGGGLLINNLRLTSKSSAKSVMVWVSARACSPSVNRWLGPSVLAAQPLGMPCCKERSVRVR